MLTRRERERKNRHKKLFFGPAWRFYLTCSRMRMFLMVGILRSKKRNLRGYGYYKAEKLSRRGC